MCFVLFLSFFLLKWAKLISLSFIYTCFTSTSDIRLTAIELYMTGCVWMREQLSMTRKDDANILILFILFIIRLFALQSWLLSWMHHIHKHHQELLSVTTVTVYYYYMIITTAIHIITISVTFHCHIFINFIFNIVCMLLFNYMLHYMLHYMLNCEFITSPITRVHQAHHSTWTGIL